jgi:DNA-binding PucR family transcriptional regulator
MPRKKVAITPRAGRAAVALRLAGASFAEIADTLALPDARAARDMVEAELAAGEQDSEQRDVLRREEAARIERLIRSVWGKAMDANNPEHLPAARAALAMVDRHARLLGLDQPTEVIVYTPTTSEIDAWVSSMVIAGSVIAGDVEEGDVLAVEA